MGSVSMGFTINDASPTRPAEHRQQRRRRILNFTVTKDAARSAFADFAPRRKS
jgi:hypothetical protein